MKQTTKPSRAIRIAVVAAFTHLSTAGVPQTAHAQVTLDVAKITCDQWAGYKITNPQNIALWLSGYYNGKRGTTELDTQKMTADTKRLRDFCIMNPQVPVMNAIEKVMAPG